MEEEKNLAKLTHDELMAMSHEDLVRKSMELQDTLEAVCEAAKSHEKDGALAESSLGLIDSLRMVTEDREYYKRMYLEQQAQYQNCKKALIALV